MLCEGISFQNLLGISLLLGDMNSSFPGEIGLDSPGEFWYAGEVIPLNAGYAAGEQSLDQDCRGCLLWIYMLLGRRWDLLEDKLTAWGRWIPIFLGKLDFPGEVLICWGSDSFGYLICRRGSDSFEYLICRRGTIFTPRLPGMLVMSMYMAAGECWDLLEDTQLP